MAGLDDAASELESIARHLRASAETELVRELNRRCARGGPGADEIRAGLRPHLPAGTRPPSTRTCGSGISVRTSDRDPGVSVTGRPWARPGSCAASTRACSPTPFGATGSTGTRSTSSPGGSPGRAQDATPQVRREIERALEDIAAAAASKTGT